MPVGRYPHSVYADLARLVGAKKLLEVAEVADGRAMLGHLVAEGEGEKRRWAVVGRR